MSISACSGTGPWLVALAVLLGLWELITASSFTYCHGLSCDTNHCSKCLPMTGRALQNVRCVGMPALTGYTVGAVLAFITGSDRMVAHRQLLASSCISSAAGDFTWRSGFRIGWSLSVLIALA
jgi:hypothetical protein